MWIKWKYNDHGWPDFKELEVPDAVFDEYGDIPNYLCELSLVPSYSERFMLSRVKWEIIEKPSKAHLTKLIKEARAEVCFSMKEVNRLEHLLTKL